MIIFQARQEASKLIDTICDTFKGHDYRKKEMKFLFENSKVTPLDAAAYAAFYIKAQEGNKSREITDQITLEVLSVKCGMDMFKINNALEKMLEEKEQGSHAGKTPLFFKKFF